MFGVTGPHMENDYLPVMGVRNVGSGDVVAEVGAEMPEGVANFGNIFGLARIQRIDLSVGRCVAGDPLLVLLERLERVEAGKENRSRRAVRASIATKCMGSLSCCDKAGYSESNLVVGAIRVGFYVDGFDVEDVRQRYCRSLRENGWAAASAKDNPATEQNHFFMSAHLPGAIR